MVTGWSGCLELGPEPSLVLERAVLRQCLHRSQDFFGFYLFYHLGLGEKALPMFAVTVENCP